MSGHASGVNSGIGKRFREVEESRKLGGEKREDTKRERCDEKERDGTKRREGDEKEREGTKMRKERAKKAEVHNETELRRSWRTMRKVEEYEEGCLERRGICQRKTDISNTERPG